MNMQKKKHNKHNFSKGISFIFREDFTEEIFSDMMGDTQEGLICSASLGVLWVLKALIALCQFEHSL